MSQSFSAKIFLEEAIETLDELRKLHERKIFGFSFQIESTTSSVLSIKELFTRRTQNPPGESLFRPPEQFHTNENHLDEKSDIYTFGLLLYMAATGSLPFIVQRKTEWHTRHHFWNPLQPNRINKDLPPILSHIILKCISKNPSKRYQSTLSLKYDLNLCHDNLSREKNFEEFALGALDRQWGIRFPEHFDGFNYEKRILRDLVSNHFKQMNFDFVVLRGKMGSGKIYLLQYLETLIKDHYDSTVIHIDLDSNVRDLPLQGLRRIIIALGKQIATSPPSTLEKFKANLNLKIGKSIPILNDLLPELNFSPPPMALAQSDLSDERNYLYFIFNILLESILTHGHHLTLGITNIQWMDHESLRYLRDFLKTFKGGPIVVACTMRDTEKTNLSPIEKLSSLQKDKELSHFGNQTILEVTGLKRRELSNFIALVLHCPNESISALSEILFEKLGGNPLLTFQTIGNLIDTQVLKFDAIKKNYFWDLKEIEGFLKEKQPNQIIRYSINSLSEKSKHLLQIMAVMGIKIELDILQDIFNPEQHELVEFLTDSVNQNIISINNGRAFFLHPQFRELTYTSMEESNRERIHLRVALYFERLYLKDNRKSNLFLATEHFHSAIKTLSLAEFERFVNYTSLCGHWSFEAGSYSTAIFYYEDALRILDFEKHSFGSNRVFDVIFNLAKLYYHVGLRQKVPTILSRLHIASLTFDQRVDLIILRIDLLIAEGEMAEAFRIGFDFLEANYNLGLRKKKAPLKQRVRQTTTRFNEWIKNKNPTSLSNLKPNRNQQLRILNALFIPAHFIQSPYLKDLALIGLSETITHGFDASSVPSFLWLGLCLLSEPNPQFDEAYRLGAFAFDMVEHFSLNDYKSHVRILFCNTIALYKKPLNLNHNLLRETLSYGSKVRDTNYTNFAYTHIITHRLFIGEDLRDVYKQALEFHQKVQSMNNKDLALVLQSQLIFIRSLIGENGYSGFSGGLAAAFELKDHEGQIRQSQMGTLKFWFYALKMQSEYIHCRYRLAKSLLVRALPLQGTDPWHLESTQFTFYGSLVLLKTMSLTDSAEKSEDRMILQLFRGRLREWAKSSPINFFAQHACLEAEIAILQGQIRKGISLFSQALKWAKEQGFIPLASVIAELTYHHFSVFQSEDVASFYLRDAISFYKAWGANMKVSQLNNTNKSLSRPPGGRTQSEGDLIYGFDELEDLIRRASDGSSDDQVHSIVNRISRFTQSDRVILATFKSNGLLTCQKSTHHRFSNHDGQWETISIESTEVPSDIINYAINTKSAVWGEVETLPPQLSRSRYIQTQQPKSLICHPLLMSEKVNGAIYIENVHSQVLHSSSYKDVTDAMIKILSMIIDSGLLREQLREEQAHSRQAKQDAFWSEQVFENSRDSIFIMDSDFRIISINRAFSLMTGYTKEEIQGMPIAGLYTGLNPKKTLLTARADLQTKGYWQGDLMSKRKNGEKFSEWLSLVSVPNEDTGSDRYIGIFFDLADRKKMEETLTRAKEQAEQAVKIRGQFLANMSHEIRTPMNAIMGFSELGLKGVNKSISKNYFDKINMSANHLLGLINDILDFSKMEAGKLSLFYETFDLKVLLKELVSIMRIKAREKKLRLELHYPDHLPTLVHSDANRIRQILMNLISNGLKFTLEGSVSVCVDQDHPNAKGGSIRISVKDTGVGIKKAEQELLFQPFSQIDSSSTRRFGGTGLGLAICYELTNLLGGTINVESTENIGSTFWIEIPINQGSIEGERPLEAHSRIGHPDQVLNPESQLHLGSLTPPHCLLVEDNIINQVVAREMLKSCNATIKVVNNGQEAVDELKVNGDQYQIVFMDIQMPQLDGYAATQIIRDKLGMKTLPIIGLTAHAFKEDRDRCYQVGMTDVLSKPVKKTDLRTVVDRFSVTSSPPP